MPPQTTPAQLRWIKEEIMKYVKMLALAAIAAAALMAFVGAGTASATVLTCEGSTCAVGAPLHAESEGKAILDAPFGNVECNSTVQGHVTNAGSSTTTATVKITELNWSNCGNDNVVTLAPGTLEIHTTREPEKINNGDGTVTSLGTEVTVEHVGTHCIFGTGATGMDIGWLTGSNNTKETATLDISATVTRLGGRSGAFCGSTAPWTGSYKITTPDKVEVD
jgi:hypothetical protein